MSTLDQRRTLWIAEEQIGSTVSLKHRGKAVEVAVPPDFRRRFMVRLRGRGATKGAQSGDLVVDLRLNKGRDVHRELWISDVAAINGTEERLRVGDRLASVRVPPHSEEGRVLRIKGAGSAMQFDGDDQVPSPAAKDRSGPPLMRLWRAARRCIARARGAAPRGIPGDLLVRLRVYAHSVSPQYRWLDPMEFGEQSLEKWVDQRLAMLETKLKLSFGSIPPLPAEEVARLFNEHGWPGIFATLRACLRLGGVAVTAGAMSSGHVPGCCSPGGRREGGRWVNRVYQVYVAQRYLDHPFCTAAILAHELCHVVYRESLLGGDLSAAVSLEEERMVDLLVFFFGLGEFQLRVARECSFTLGYFNQNHFERVQWLLNSG
jgi:hypothetical protein